MKSLAEIMPTTVCPLLSQSGADEMHCLCSAWNACARARTPREAHGRLERDTDYTGAVQQRTVPKECSEGCRLLVKTGGQQVPAGSQSGGCRAEQPLCRFPGIDGALGVGGWSHATKWTRRKVAEYRQGVGVEESHEVQARSGRGGKPRRKGKEGTCREVDDAQNVKQRTRQCRQAITKLC